MYTNIQPNLFVFYFASLRFFFKFHHEFSIFIIIKTIFVCKTLLLSEKKRRKVVFEKNRERERENGREIPPTSDKNEVNSCLHIPRIQLYYIIFGNEHSQSHNCHFERCAVCHIHVCTNRDAFYKI